MDSIKVKKMTKNEQKMVHKRTKIDIKPKIVPKLDPKLDLK